jgi:hypothetical protein
MDSTVNASSEWAKEPLRFWLMPFRLILFMAVFSLLLNPNAIDDWDILAQVGFLSIFFKALFAWWIGLAASVYTEEKIYAWLLHFPRLKTLNESRKFQNVTEGARRLILVAALTFLVFLFIRFESMRDLFMNPLVLLWAGVIIGAFLIDKWHRRNAPPSL